MQSNSIGHVLVILAVWLVSFNVQSSQNDLREVSFYTEEYPPANFQKDGKIAGHSVEILMQASALVGEPISESQLTLQPWSLSYSTVLTQKNSVLFSTTRSAHRENLFQWVGPIVDVKLVVLARKDSNIKIDDPIQMANYRIGVIRDGIGEQTLLELGIPRYSMQEGTHATVLVEQLMKKRIDLLVYGERGAYWWSKQAGVDPSLFETIYILQEGSIYFA